MCWMSVSSRSQARFMLCDRRIVLDSSEKACRRSRGGDARSDVEAFGLPASLLDYGTGRYRLDVLIGEHTFEFDGEPFANVEDFLATVNALQPSASAPPAEVTAEPVWDPKGERIRG